MIVPILQTGDARNVFASMESICLNAGYAVSVWVNYGSFVGPSEISWRRPYIVLVIVFPTLLIFLPEMPGWLIKNSFQIKGLSTLAGLYGTIRQTPRFRQVMLR